MTFLVDTCVWTNHFRRGAPALVAALTAREVVTHPAIVGELVLGGLSLENRQRLQWLPTIAALSDADVLAFVDKHRLVGAGIGWVDCHLLAAAASRSPCLLWTTDQKLRRAAAVLSLSR